jgi:DNA-binding MarR family transcriptional regulator
VAAAYDAAVEETHTAAEIATALPPLAAELLMRLSQRPALPKELASTLNKDRAAVSRTLAKLHRAHLVQDYSIQSGADGRVRPQRLTLLGQRVVQYLANRVPAPSQPARPAAVPKVRANRRAGSEALRSELEPAVPTAD